MDSWNCTYCGLEDCDHLNSVVVPKQTNTYWPEPESHKLLQENDLFVISGIDCSFRIDKNVVPENSILFSKMTNQYFTGTNRFDIPLSQGAMKFIYWFFFDEISGNEIVYKSKFCWIDPISENNQYKVHHINEKDLEYICFAETIKHIYSDMLLSDDSHLLTVPKVHGYLCPTRAFVRVLSEYLCFPHRLEKFTMVSLEQDHNETRKIHQRLLRTY